MGLLFSAFLGLSGSSGALCEHCMFEYDAEQRKPLVLPCGHSFCKICILKIPSTKKACFDCGASWSCYMKDLPVCYQLLPDMTSSEASPPANMFSLSETNSCQKHSNELDFWCNTCYRELCEECLSEEHKGCKTIVSDSVLNKPDGFLAEAAKVLKKKATRHLHYLQGLFKNSEVLASLMCNLKKVGGLWLLVENEKTNLENSRAANQAILKSLNGYGTSKMTHAQKRNFMRMSTISFVNSQKETKLSDVERKRVNHLCSIITSAETQMQQFEE